MPLSPSRPAFCSDPGGSWCPRITLIPWVFFYFLFFIYMFFFLEFRVLDFRGFWSSSGVFWDSVGLDSIDWVGLNLGCSSGSLIAELCHGAVTRSRTRRRVLDRRKRDAVKSASIFKFKASSTGSVCKCLLRWPSPNSSQEERISSSQNMGSKCCKFIKYDYQRRLRLSFDIPCTNEGGIDSSGETYSYSDGETSSAGLPDASDTVLDLNLNGMSFLRFLMFTSHVTPIPST
ncbi:hypothetical protein M758_UG062400 [Ceratodon purpureus]|nr:hypothetical protein M758_UG062400 [Ceratodon purpureus]